jgi:hypothetical protein
MAVPAVKATSSVVIINENDHLLASQINHNSSRFTMGIYGNNAEVFHHHIGIAFMRVPGDIRSFWTLLSYPADVTSLSPQLLEAIKQTSAEQTLGIAAPFKLKEPIVVSLN